MQIFTPPMPSTSQASVPDVNDFNLAYKDDEDDLVLITADSDVMDAVKVARHQNRDRVLLVLQGGKSWDEAVARDGSYGKSATSSAATAENRRRQRELAEQQMRSVQKEENSRPEKQDDDLIFGFLPKDLALPAAIGFLGVAVIAAVSITRFGGRP